jgi:hypothetical protein
MSFHIGQEVVCVDASGRQVPLKMHKCYVAGSLMTCKCGLELISVGLPNFHRRGIMNCYTCGDVYVGKIMFHRTSRFRPLDSIPVNTETLLKQEA